ncbi:MAG: phosphatase PAP2 family protein [Clostridia bacterium]|nr:phosphatase PAP2 family protein [Clostridia bacterium]
MELTGNTFFFPWEVSLEEWLQANLGSTGTGIISFFSAFGEEMILILVMGLLYWVLDKKMGKRVGLSVLAAMTWNAQFKNIFLRRRPYMDHEGIQILRVVEPSADPMDLAAQGYSFPSGHSANASSVYASLAAELKKKWMTALAVVLPLLVGCSRVVVGAHYPTDVMVGWVLGLLAVLIVRLLSGRIRNELALNGIVLLTAVPGFFFCRSEDYFSSVGLMIGFMLGSMLEEKKVNFENTRNVLFGILRLVGGFAIYFLLNTALKMPFSKDFLSGGSTGALLVRAARYAIVAFVEFGIYPMIFAKAEGALSGKKGR